MIKIGQVYTTKDGTGIRIEEYDERGQFTAQLRSMTTGEWTGFRMQGDAIKLPLFLKQQGATLDSEESNAKD